MQAETAVVVERMGQVEAQRADRRDPAHAEADPGLCLLYTSGTLKRPEDFAADDYRRFSPRFQGENFAKNLKLVDKVGELAAAKGVKPSQLALAWVLAQGDDLIPIPGTKQRRYLEENVAATELRLSAAELAELDAIFPAEAVAGSRYSEEGMRLVNL